MIYIGICDDVEVFIDKLEALIREYETEIQEEIKIDRFTKGIDLLNKYKSEYDLIFLDIKMPDMNGITVAENIRSRDSKVSIIFLTSLVQYALEGYRVNAVNYIVKPISYKKLKLELDNWRKKYGQKEEPYLIVRNDNGSYKLLLKSIRYIETYNRNLLIHTEHKNIISYKKLQDMEKLLSDQGFVRCHTSYLVHLLYVETIENMEAQLITNEKIPISKLKKKEFMTSLAEYWGDQL